jgi:hypothetical protein
VQTSMARAMRSLCLVVLTLSAVLVAGCTEGSGDCSQSQMATDEGSLAFNGACTGTQKSTFHCDGAAEVDVALNLAKGEVEVTVEDADGEQVYHREHGAGPLADERDVSGKAGTWTVTAERKGDLSGQYAIDVDCEE